MATTSTAATVVVPASVMTSGPVHAAFQTVAAAAAHLPAAVLTSVKASVTLRNTAAASRCTEKTQKIKMKKAQNQRKNFFHFTGAVKN